MRGAVPAIEIADDADVLRVRRPDPEDGPPLDRVRAELLPEVVVTPLVEEVVVPVGEESWLAAGFLGSRVAKLLSCSIPGGTSVFRPDIDRHAGHDVGADGLRLLDDL